MNETSGEFRLDDPPQDGITAVEFGTSTYHLLVSSWDCTIRMHDIKTNILRSTFKNPSSVLDCCYYGSTHAVGCDTNGCVKMFDLNSSQESQLGTHNKPVRSVCYSSDVKCLISGSWDHSVKVWDPRSISEITSIQQPDKVYTMTNINEKLIVGTAGRRILIWDLRNMGTALQKRESSLKYQTRCIKAFPNGQGYVVSSIEGRVAVEYFDPANDIQKKKYAFKCHRIKEDGTEKIYPVNAISFHPNHNTFATGGSDGLVNIWDGFNKKRLCQFHRFPTTISSLCFNNDGTMLAIASSYMMEEGDKPDSPPDSIFMRPVTDQETKPK